MTLVYDIIWISSSIVELGLMVLICKVCLKYIKDDYWRNLYVQKAADLHAWKKGVDDRLNNK